MRVAVFLIITFTNFQEKLLFHSVVMFTELKMLDIVLLYALLIVLSMFIIAVFRGGSRTAVTSKMKHFVIIVNGWKHCIWCSWHD